MSKRKLIEIPSEEFIKKLDSGERDFRYIKLTGQRVGIFGKPNERGKINLEQYKDVFLQQFGIEPWKAPLLLKGSVFHNVNLNRTWLDYMQAEGADFSGSDICRAHMRRANLVKAKMNGTYLVSTEMTKTNFRDAEMKDMKMWYAKLPYSNLYRADLSDTIAHGADMREVNLKNANLKNVRLDNADLSEANLTGAYNLDSVQLLGANCYKTMVTEDQRAILLPKMKLDEYLIIK